MGIHGPSVVKPALNAALFGNITTNLATLQAGGHPALALTENFGNYIGELGGTGATFIVPMIFLLFMRSKQLKAVGKASVVPVMFAVNEPLLFAPIILNPYFLIPFLFPVANVLIRKFFIDSSGHERLYLCHAVGTPRTDRHLHRHQLPAEHPSGPGCRPAGR